MVERDWWKDDDVSDVAEAFETEHSEGVPVPEFGEEERALNKDAFGLVIGASATVIVLLSVAVVLLWVWAEVEDVSIGGLRRRCLPGRTSTGTLPGWIRCRVTEPEWSFASSIQESTWGTPTLRA